MRVELLKTQRAGVCVNDMADGQIAEIVSWGNDVGPIGKIVQRYKNVLVVLGAKSDQCWGTIFEHRHEECRVRPLEPGEHIVVKSN